MANAVAIQVELPVPRPILVDAPDDATFAIGNDPYFAGASGDGAADDKAAFVNAAAGLPTGTEIIISRGRFKVASTHTFTNPLRFEAGGTLVIPDGVTVTLSGAVTAPPVKLFECSGTGKVVLSAGTKVVYPEWWGGTTDTSIDSTAAFQACIDAAAPIRATVVAPPLKHGAIALRKGTRLEGQGADARLVAAAGSYALLTFADEDISVRNLAWDCAARTGGAEIHFACGTTPKNRLLLENLFFFGGIGGWTDSGTDQGFWISTNIRMLQFRQHRGPGLDLKRAFGFVYPEKVTVDYVGVPTSDFTGFKLDFAALGEGSGGVFFRDCDVGGTAGTYNLPNQRGFDVRNADAVGFFNTRADTLGEKGYVLKNVNKVEFEAEAGLCVGHAVEFDEVTNARGKLAVFGRKGLNYAPPNADGLHFVGLCSDINLNVVVRDMTRHGVNKAANQPGAITLQLDASFNGGLGINSVGDSSLVVFGKLQGNLGGDYSLTGTGDFFLGKLNSGAFVFAGKMGYDTLSQFGLRAPLIFAGTAYTLNSNDLNSYIRFTSTSAVTVTVPLNSVQAFPIGAEVEIEKAGTGNVTVAGASGVDVGAAGGLTISNQFQSRRLKKVGADAWVLL